MTDHEQRGISDAEITALTTEDARWKEFRRELIAMNLRLSNQDVVIDSTNTAVRQIAEDTAAMRAAWNDGVAVKRFFCRLAQAWTFLLHKVFLPVVLPITCLWSLFRLAHHEALPEWLIAGIKLLNIGF